jgi:hypothetical protein
LDGLGSLPRQGLRRDAVASDDPDHVPMDGQRSIGVVANFQIELKADEIIEFEVGIVVLIACLTNNGDLDPISY